MTDGCVSVEFQTSAPHVAMSASSEQHEPSPVDHVGERAAEQPEREHRNQLGQAEQPHCQRRSRERVDLVRDRHERQHRAEERRELPEEEQPEVAVAPQGGDVDDGVAQETPERAHRPSETCAS
jgi:hypothetical protein